MHEHQQILMIQDAPVINDLYAPVINDRRKFVSKPVM